MLDDVLGTLAGAKEWGLIILFVAVFCFIIRYIIKSQTDREKLNSEREVKMMGVMVRFSDNIPQLTAAINELRQWLGDKFVGVEEDLETLKTTNEELGDRIENHENRIVFLEDISEHEKTEKKGKSKANGKQTHF